MNSELDTHYDGSPSWTSYYCYYKFPCSYTQVSTVNDSWFTVMGKKSTWSVKISNRVLRPRNPKLLPHFPALGNGCSSSVACRSLLLLFTFLSVTCFVCPYSLLALGRSSCGLLAGGTRGLVALLVRGVVVALPALLACQNCFRKPQLRLTPTRPSFKKHLLPFRRLW